MTRISVATFNLHNELDRWFSRRELIVQQLYEKLPDIICLQEIAITLAQGQWLRHQLNRQVSMREEGLYQLYERRSRHPFYYFLAGVGILCRLPIVARDWLVLGGSGRVAVRINVTLPNGESADVVSVHLTPHLSAEETREEELLRLVGWLQDSGSVRHQIIGGTFRANPNSRPIQRMKQFYSYRSAYEWVNGREPLATFPTPLIETNDRTAVCHDYLFVSPHFAEIESAELICQHPSPTDPTLYPSDHVGLMATIVL